MLETLHQLFCDTLRRDLPPFTPAQPFSEIEGWDSVSHLALLLTIEQHYAIAFTSAEMVSMQTVGDLIASLTAHGATEGGRAHA